MEDLEKLLGETTELEEQGANSSEYAPLASQSLEWCESCWKQAKEMKEKYSRNFIAIKQKIFFTDNLIHMYQIAKKQLEEMTEKFNQATKDKTLIQAQLELLLSKEQPSFSENETFRLSHKMLEEKVEDLKVQLHAMDESRRIHEESIKILKAEDSGAVYEIKKKYLQQISELKKTLAEKIEDKRKLSKKNRNLQHRVDKLAIGRRRKFSSSKEHDGDDNQTSNTAPAVLTSTGDILLSDCEMSNDDGIESSKPRPSQDIRSITAAKLKVAIAVAHITNTSDENDSPTGQVKEIPLTADMKQKEEGAGARKTNQDSEQPLITQLTERQLSDLTSLATNWKASLNKKPGPGKQELMKRLLDSTSAFCAKHHTESMKIVLTKLYDMHKDIYSKRHQRWIRDVMNKTKLSHEKSSAESLEVPGTSANQVDKERVSFIGSTKADGHVTLGNIASEKKHAVVFKDSGHEAKTTERDDDNISLVEVGQDKDYISTMPVLTDVTVTSANSSETVTICNKVDVSVSSVKSQCTLTKTHKISSEYFDSKAAKRHNMEEPRPTAPVSRRRTRSMTMSSLSEEDDVLISSPPRRSRRISQSRVKSPESSLKETKSPRRTSNAKTLTVTKTRNGQTILHQMKSVESVLKKSSSQTDKQRESLTENSTTQTSQERLQPLGSVETVPKKTSSQPDKQRENLTENSITQTSQECLQRPGSHREVSEAEESHSPILQETKTTEIVRKEISNQEGDIIDILAEESVTEILHKHIRQQDARTKLNGNRQEKSIEMTDKDLLNTSGISICIDSPVDSDVSDGSHDLSDIFDEMLGFDIVLLSPIAKSPVTEKKKSDVIDTEKVSEPATRESDETLETENEDFTVVLPSDHKGRNSISPSTDLCTALNFTNLTNDLIGQEAISETLDIDLGGVDTIDDQKQSSPNSTTVVDSKNLLSQSAHPESPLLRSITSAPKDILKPRRFSCEAPEKAVSVPPIKPPSTGTSFERIHSLVVSATNDPGINTNFAPLRKEGDIPSHWHQSTSYAAVDKGEYGKEMNYSDDDRISKSPKRDAKPKAAIADVSISSDYDTDKVFEDMSGSTRLLSALDSESDAGNSVKLAKTNAAVLNYSPRKDVSNNIMASSVYEAKAKSINMEVGDSGTQQGDLIEKNIVSSGDSSAEDESLIIDISDYHETDQEMEQKKTSSIKFEPGSNAAIDTSPISKPESPNQADSPNMLPVLSLEKAENGEETYYIRTTIDFKLFVSKGAGKENRKVVVEDSFVVEGVIHILKNTVKEFDLFGKGGDDSNGYTIQDIPACEQSFLRQIYLLHMSDEVEANFLTDTVIPFLLRIHDRFGNSQTSREKFVKNGKDAFWEQLLPFLSREKHFWVLSLSRMHALLRVFVFICKMAESFGPVYSICRYHLLRSKGANALVSLVQGLMCWPRGLKEHSNLGKTVLRVMRKSLMSAQVFGQKNRVARLEKQLNWIEEQCCWQTSMNQSRHHSALHMITVKNAISAIEDAGLSEEFKEFLVCDREDETAFIHTVPVFNQETMMGIYILEFFPKETVVDEIRTEIFDRRFWPLLNSWSQHTHVHGDVDKDRKVSNICTMAILDSLSRILSFYLLRQKQHHKDQPTTPKLQSYYKTICSLMEQMSTLYLHKAPRLVQCATASFLLRTCFCNPTAAYSPLLKWAKATATSASCKRHKNLALVTMLSECDEHSLKHVCHWLDRACSVQSEVTLEKCFWPD